MTILKLFNSKRLSTALERSGGEQGVMVGIAGNGVADNAISILFSVAVAIGLGEDVEVGIGVDEGFAVGSIGV